MKEWKKQVNITKAQAGGKPGCSTVDHLIVLKQTKDEITKNGKTAYIVYLDIQKAYDKAWLDAILYALYQNGVEGKNVRTIKHLNSNLTARIQTRYGLTRKICIRDSIRQGGVLSVIEYATLIDEIAKQLKQRRLGYETQTNITLDSLLWTDDVWLIHHNPDKLQEILNITNHVANKYHLQFGVVKCKVIKIGKGKKSSLTLNGEILEEVRTYKYLEETIHNKGNLADHISEIERKLKGAIASIMAETGNKEFKGIKMNAIWQMVDAIVIPIITYACEGWKTTKEENNKLQRIFNDAIKTLLYLPKGTPTTILLNETGNIPIEYIIKKKKNTPSKKNKWNEGRNANKGRHKPRKQHVEGTHSRNSERTTCTWTNANPIQRCPQKANRNRNKNENTRRNSHRSRKENQSQSLEKMEKRNHSRSETKYMDKLSRKQCKAVLRARASMLMVREN